MLGLKSGSRLMMMAAASDNPLVVSTIHTSTPSLGSSRNAANSIQPTTTKRLDSSSSAPATPATAAAATAAPEAVAANPSTAETSSSSSSSEPPSSSSPCTQVLCSDDTTITQCIELQLIPPTAEQQSQEQQETETLTSHESSKMGMLSPPSSQAPSAAESQGINLDYICQQIRDGMRDQTCVSDLKLIFQTPTAMMRNKPPSSSRKLPKLTVIPPGFFGSKNQSNNTKISSSHSSLWKKQPLIRQSSNSSATSTSCSSLGDDDNLLMETTATSEEDELQRIKAEREQLKRRLRESCHEVDQLKVRVKLLRAEKELATKKLQLHQQQEQQRQRQQQQQLRKDQCASPLAPFGSQIVSQESNTSGVVSGVTSIDEDEDLDDPCSSSDTTALADNLPDKYSNLDKYAIVSKPSKSSESSSASTATPQLPAQPTTTAVSSSSQEEEDRKEETNNFNREVLDTLRRVKIQLEETVVAQRAKIESLASINHEQRQQLLVRTMVDESNAIESDTEDDNVGEVEEEDNSLESLPSASCLERLSCAVGTDEDLKSEQQQQQQEVEIPAAVSQAGDEAVSLAEEVAAAAVGLSQLEELENLWDQQQAQCATIQQTQDEMFRQLGQQSSEATTKIDKLCNSIGLTPSPPSSTKAEEEDSSSSEKKKMGPIPKDEGEAETLLLQRIMQESVSSDNNDPLHESERSYSVIAQCELAWMQQTQEIEELQRQQDRVLARLRQSTSENSGDDNNNNNNDTAQQEEAVSRALQPLYTEQRVKDEIVKQSAGDATLKRTSSDDKDSLKKKPPRPAATVATKKKKNVEDTEKQQLIRKLKAAETKAACSQDRVVAHSKRINSLELLCQNQESTLGALRKDNETLMQTCETLKTQLNQTEKACEEYRSKISKLREEKVVLEHDLEAQTHRFEKGQAVADQQRETIACLQKECSTLEDLLQEHRFRTKILEDECASQKAVIKDLQTAKDDLTNRFLQNQEEFRNHLTKNLSWQGQVKELRTKLEKVKALRGKLADEMSSVVQTRSIDGSSVTNHHLNNLNIGEVSFQTNITDLTSFDEEDAAVAVVAENTTAAAVQDKTAAAVVSAPAVDNGSGHSSCLEEEDAAAVVSSSSPLPTKEEEEVIVVEASVSDEDEEDKAVREALHILQLLSFAIPDDTTTIESKKEEQGNKIQESEKVTISVGGTAEEEDSFTTAMEDGSNPCFNQKVCPKDEPIEEKGQKTEREEPPKLEYEESEDEVEAPSSDDEKNTGPVVVLQDIDECVEVSYPETTNKTVPTVKVASNERPKDDGIPKESIRTHARKLLAKKELPPQQEPVATPKIEEGKGQDPPAMIRTSSSIRIHAREILEKIEIVSPSASNDEACKSAGNVVVEKMSSAVSEDGNDTECSVEDSDCPQDESSSSSSTFENSNKSKSSTVVTAEASSSSLVSSDKEKLAAEEVLRFLSFSVAF